MNFGSHLNTLLHISQEKFPAADGIRNSIPRIIMIVDCIYIREKLVDDEIYRDGTRLYLVSRIADLPSFRAGRMLMLKIGSCIKNV